jgi:hypothetical protein
VKLELERVRRHLRAQNKSERVDAAQVQLAFADIANSRFFGPAAASGGSSMNNVDEHGAGPNHQIRSINPSG